MAHTEVGFAVINKFLADIAIYGHPDFPPKLIGRGINVMISPLPRNKRGKNPRADANEPVRAPEKNHQEPSGAPRQPKPKIAVPAGPESSGLNDTFAKLQI
jgi:translation initiation factor IF-3